ncbi:MAG TPA: tetratricopeptide repeat protein [Blastocatellia bacterium]|nr:tetratricopeptide repeat protein [Blastocatellia bacterium]
MATVSLIAFLLFPAPAVTAQTPMTQGRVEIVSLLGVRHYAQVDSKNEIKAAEIRVLNDPKNVELLIALGRAQANVWQYHDAIDSYSRAIRIAPDNALLYRHRGHRYISIREFDNALRDLKKAAQLNDQDYDIWYHLGLAYYLKGEFASAAEAYKRCLAVAEKNAKDDSIIAVSDWLYMTWRRMKKEAEAKQVLDRITPDMKVVENKSYFDRLLFYKGLKTEAELVNLEKATDLEIATIGYGLGNWHLYNGNPAKAEEYFRKIVSGRYWPAFGFIAAEVELARKGKR